MGKANRSPAVNLRDALRGTAKGVPSSFTMEEFVADMKLDGDQPDGLTLVYRLLGSGK